MKFICRNLFLALLLGVFAFGASASAAPLLRVTVNTASLIGSSSAPFALDFQFNNGSVLGNNNITVSNFNYFGGGPVGSPTTFDGATGNIGSSVFFNNSGPFQELYQTFTPGTSLRFDVSYIVAPENPIPDAFVFSILDKNLLTIPTNGLGDSLLLINFDSLGGIPQTFAGTGNFSGVTVSTTTVPEAAPSTMLLAGLPLLALVAYRRSRI